MLTAPFTIGVYMVRDFQRERTGSDVVDEQVVGRLTGLLAGIFSFASFLTAYAWGWVSNYIGRKVGLGLPPRRAAGAKGSREQGWRRVGGRGGGGSGWHLVAASCCA